MIILNVGLVVVAQHIVTYFASSVITVTSTASANASISGSFDNCFYNTIYQHYCCVIIYDLCYVIMSALCLLSVQLTGVSTYNLECLIGDD